MEKEYKANALVIETDVSNENEVKSCINKIIGSKEAEIKQLNL